jgi:DNA helicase-2/ATP-dependent DNA helicase PcrA
VDNFEARIKRFFDNPLESLYKYRVRTLHGLAHDIVREKPSRVGLEDRFSIIDEREAGYIRKDAVNAWLASPSLDDYLDPGLEQSKRDWVRRDQLPDMVDSLALAFIRSSKDRLLTPEMLRLKLDQSPTPLPLAELGWSIYADYQRALAYRGAVDFDDLIRLALTLETDDEYLGDCVIAIRSCWKMRRKTRSLVSTKNSWLAHRQSLSRWEQRGSTLMADWSSGIRTSASSKPSPPPT